MRATAAAILAALAANTATAAPRCWLAGDGSVLASTANLGADRLTIDMGANGASGGASAGCDLVAGSLVAGVFGRYGFGAATADITASPGQAHVRIDDGWSIGGRLGFAPTSSAIVYGLAGWTSSRLTYEEPGYSERQALAGPLVGLGAEIDIAGPIALRLEYAASLYGREGLAIDDITVDGALHSVRAGVVVRWP